MFLSLRPANCSLHSKPPVSRLRPHPRNTGTKLSQQVSANWPRPPALSQHSFRNVSARLVGTRFRRTLRGRAMHCASELSLRVARQRVWTKPSPSRHWLHLQDLPWSEEALTPLGLSR